MTIIVVAAGASRRFGWANKLLAPAPRRPLIVVTVGRVLAATRGPVILVLGPQSRALLRALARHGLLGPRLHLAWHRQAARGLGHSLGHGLRAAPRLDTTLTVHLADVPYFRPVGPLRRAIHGGAEAARFCHADQPGHPIRLRRRLLSGHGADLGLRDGLKQLDRKTLIRLPTARGVIADIDHRQMIRNLI